MWQEQHLLASYKDGQTRLNAHLDDYAFLADRLLGQFEDQEQSGFFFTSHDHQQLIHRPKPDPDQAPPGQRCGRICLIALGAFARRETLPETC